jgi:hypothetical protein
MENGPIFVIWRERERKKTKRKKRITKKANFFFKKIVEIKQRCDFFQH